MVETHQTRSSAENFLSYLKSIPVRHAMLQHPYYARRWAKGCLTLGGMQLYCRQNRIEQLFQESLCVVKNRVKGEPDVLAVLDQNLQAEQGHMNMWLNFTGGCGVSPKDIGYAQLLPGTQGLFNAFKKITYEKDVNFWMSIGAFFAFESQMPAIAAAKLEAIDRYYAGYFSNLAAASEYYEVHMSADQEHTEWWLLLFENNCASLDDRKAALTGAHMMCQALLGLLDSINEVDKTHRFIDPTFLAAKYPPSTAMKMAMGA